jgi:hypothetical protein
MKRKFPSIQHAISTLHSAGFKKDPSVSPNTFSRVRAQKKETVALHREKNRTYILHVEPKTVRFLQTLT